MNPLVKVFAVLLATGAILASSGCEFTGINSKTLPLTKGGGDDDYQVTVAMENAVNLVPNSEVKVSEVTVGSVRKIEFDAHTYTARLTLGIEKETRLPKNVRATIGQKSLLGAEYLALEAPEEPSAQQLADGDHVGLDQTGRFPETEEVLSSLSLLLNGGGLGQLQTITRELNLALSGNEQEVRSMVTELDTFVGTLADQRGDIIEALEGLDNLSQGYAEDTATIDRALRSIPGGVEALESERTELTESLRAAGEFGDIAHQIVRDTRTDLTHNLNNLENTVGGLADGSDVLIDALGSITWPFPVDSVLRTFVGDYANFFPTIDVSLGTIERDFLGGTSLDGIYAGLLGQLAGGPTPANNDPLIDPLNGLTDVDGVGKPSPQGPACLLDGIPLLTGNCDSSGGDTSAPAPKPSAPTPKPTSQPGLLDGLFRGLGGGA